MPQRNLILSDENNAYLTALSKVSGCSPSDVVNQLLITHARKSASAAKPLVTNLASTKAYKDPKVVARIQELRALANAKYTQLARTVATTTTIVRKHHNTYAGVSSRRHPTKPWVAQVPIPYNLQELYGKKKQIFLGAYATELEAAKRAELARESLHRQTTKQRLEAARILADACTAVETGLDIS